MNAIIRFAIVSHVIV